MEKQSALYVSRHPLRSFARTLVITHQIITRGEIRCDVLLILEVQENRTEKSSCEWITKAPGLLVIRPEIFGSSEGLKVFNQCSLDKVVIARSSLVHAVIELRIVYVSKW